MVLAPQLNAKDWSKALAKREAPSRASAIWKDSQGELSYSCKAVHEIRLDGLEVARNKRHMCGSALVTICVT